MHDYSKRSEEIIHSARGGTGRGPAPLGGKAPEGPLAVKKISPLSKAHIRPFHDSEPKLEYIEGGSLLRSTKDISQEPVGGGRRGFIKGFSKQSRLRLLELIATIRRDAELPNFITLTYPSQFPTVERAKRDLDVFERRFKRRFPEAGAIWKLEPQERGAPHYHLMAWGADLYDLLPWVIKNWYEIAGNGDRKHYLWHMGGVLKGYDGKVNQPCVTTVRSFRGVWSYASKYLGKTFDVAGWGTQWTGRFWGVINRQNIPFGEKKVIKISYKDVVQIMRLQRRFMSMRRRRNLNSLKTFCNADHWVNQLYQGEVKSEK